MNKRIRKKRRKLRSICVLDRVYTHKEIERVHKLHIGYVSMRILYPKIKNPKLTRPRTRSLINYIYRNGMKYIENFSFELETEIFDDKPIMIQHPWRFNIL